MSPFLVLAALLPAALLLLRVYRLDRIEKEPASVLWALLGCGAAAALLAYLLETLLTALLDRWLVRGSMAYLAAENFLVVACTEELCKRLPVRHIFWRHRAFDYRFDAVVYCVFSALGFAALENVLYVADSGFRTAVMRALLSVPGHFFFAVYMGVYLGEAKSAETRGLRRQQRCSTAQPTPPNAITLNATYPTSSLASTRSSLLPSSLRRALRKHAMPTEARLARARVGARALVSRRRTVWVKRRAR